jgi:glycosyltransferase involved in cell wall biosynthesis
MKVLHVIDSFSYGGAERLLATLNTVADNVGLELSAASLSPFTVERTASLQLLVDAGLAPTFIGARRMLFDRHALSLVRTAIRASGCDVVHAHLGTSAFLVPIAARQVGVPCVSTLHHVPSRNRSRRLLLKEWLWTRSAERGAALVYVSEAARRAAADLVGPARPTWQVVYNGVDLSRFTPVGEQPGALPADLPVPPGALVVTIVAALREPKGHAVALQAWSRVRSKHPDAVLLVVGDGPHAPALHALAGDGVVFAGAREDVPQILRGSTLALLPSLTEALPTATIEAAAAGLAVVATTVGGTPETVEHGETGLLVPPGDAQALADSVIGLLDDPVRRGELGRNARKLAEERFDVRSWARQLKKLYEESLARHRGTARGVAR